VQLGAWRLQRCISRRAPQIESFFASRESRKRGGFACLADDGWTAAEVLVFELLGAMVDTSPKWL
jgi:hypothetical protein